MPVAKDIPGGRTGSGPLRFASAIRYAATVNDRTSELAAVSERFAASIDHVAKPDIDPTHRAHRGERVEQVILSGIFSLETAAIELDAIAALRPRVSDPVRHIVLSYDTVRGERPSPEQIDGDVKTLLRQRGFTDAQDRGQRHHETAAARFEAARRGSVSPFVAIVHGDTDAKHVHVIVSTVAPNGAVNSDFRRYGANEHAAAMIAQAHGWEIVAGRRNGRLVAEQARSRGASDAEIEALLRRDAATLERLRERDRGGDQPTGRTRSDTGGIRRRGGFILEYGEAIRIAFARSGSFDEFKDALREIGVIAKYSEAADRRTGRVLPRLAFADAIDKAGDSGSRVGVAAKSLIEKFGLVFIEARTPIVGVEARSECATETIGTALADMSRSAQSRPPHSHADVPDARRRRGGSPDFARTVSGSSARGLAPAERALATAALLRKPVLRDRRDGLDWTLAVLGFASESMRAVRRRRQERRRRELQDGTRSSRTEDAKPLDLENAQERLARRRATVLARDARTPSGLEARDRALADLDMRAKYAAWKDAETEKQLIGIRAERADAFAAHERETQAQLQRVWEVEKLFRGALRSVGIRGAAARRMMAEAYEVRRSAVLAARKVVWAAVDGVSPEVKTYADWLMEQGGVVADRACAQFAFDVRSGPAKSGTAEPDQPMWVAPERNVDPAHPVVIAATETSESKAVSSRSGRFGAIFDRSDAEARDAEAVRRAANDAESAERVRVERITALERAVVKAAGKILGTVALARIDAMRDISHEPQRSAAVADLRDMIISAGVQRRSRPAARLPEAGEIRRVPRPKDVRSR